MFFEFSKLIEANIRKKKEQSEDYLALEKLKKTELLQELFYF